MTCSECWTTVPAGTHKCPRCGAKITGSAPSVLGLLKNYPWLAVLLGLSLFVTLWAATRRAPAARVVEDIPPTAEPVAEAPPPEPETQAPAMPMPVPEAEPAAAAAPEPVPVTPLPAGQEPSRPGMGAQRPDGTFEADLGNLRRGKP